MIAQTYPNISNITSLQAKIDSLQSTLSASHHARTVTFYEDDSFAFEIDENGHQIARLKANDRLRDFIEACEKQKQQIIALRIGKNQLEIQCNALQEANSQLQQQNKKVEDRMKAIGGQFSNLKNKFKILVQHCRPNPLLETFLEQFEKAPHSSTQQIIYKVIEIPVEREVIVEVPVQRIRTVEIQVEIPVQVVREVPIYIDRVVEVEKLVQIESIVEVQSQPNIVYVERIKEVPLYVERVVEVIKEIEVPVEVQILRVVQVERIVQVEVEVEVPVDRIVEKIVYQDVPVEKIVIVEKIVNVEVPVEVEVLVEKIVEVEVERVVEVPLEKIVEVYIQKITQIPINHKQTQQLKSQLQAIQFQTIKQTEEIAALKNLLATQQQLNHQNNNLIAQLNHQILQLSANNTPRKRKTIFNATAQSSSTINHINDSNGTNHANELNNGSSFSRIKILSTHPRKALSEALKNHLLEIPNKDLSVKITMFFQEIAQKLQAQQSSNAHLAQVIQKMQRKTDDTAHLVLLQQVQAEKQSLLGEISALRRQNHQIQVQLQSHESNSETEHLIQHLTSQLQQQRNNSSQALLDNQHLKEIIQRLQAELSQNNYQKKT